MHFQMNKTIILKLGFTLVELIVVIAIIGILATIGVSSYQNILNKSKQTKINSDLDDLKKGIITARITTGKTFGQITGNYCSACNACWGAGDLRNVPDSHACVLRWKNVITTISAAGPVDITGLSRDAWGSPYVVDENDGEWIATPCRIDNLTSPGPNGIASDADDIRITIPMVWPGC